MTHDSHSIALDSGRLGPSPLAGGARASLLNRITYLRDVTVHLVRRDFATRHRGSLLGWFWALAPPLLQLIVTYFVFTKVLRLHVKDYPVFLLTAILCWNWFARSCILGATSLESRRELVLRPGFPTILLPVSAVLIGLLDYVLTLPVLLIAIALGPGLHPAALLLPIPIAIQLVLSIGVCWILAPLQIYFRDIHHLTGIAILLGFWITPIWYQRSQVPGRFAIIYKANPMTHLIEGQRQLLLDGKIPSVQSLGYVALGGVVLAAIGYAVFSRLRESLPEHL
jgi:homopolymeric O-antigen transport system permease protein